MGNKQATAVKKEGATPNGTDAPEEGAGTVGDEGRRSEPSLGQGKGQGSADGGGEVRPEAGGSDAIVAGTQELARAVLSGDKDGPAALGQGAEVTKVAKVTKDAAACIQQVEAAVAALIPAGAVEAADQFAAERSAVREEGEEDQGGDEGKEEEEVVVEEEEFKEEEVVEEKEEEVDDEKERHLEKVYNAHRTEEDDEEDAQVVPPFATAGAAAAAVASAALSKASPVMAQTPVTLIRAHLLEPAINVKDGATPTSDETSDAAELETPDSGEGLEGVNEEVKEVEKTRKVGEVPVVRSTRDDDDDDDGDAVSNVDAGEEEEVMEVAYVVMEKEEEEDEEEEEEELPQQLKQNKMAEVVVGADVESSPFRAGGEDLHGDLLDAVLRGQEFSTQIQPHI
ncbi:uncharacterized protein LOC116954224 [Petromyzon marinus]|uniref:uncharacterized protein LOC116954224 n=1 Tax=Petromyzon marinus TaxID=7757 RepID=UPI003F720055